MDLPKPFRWTKKALLKNKKKQRVTHVAVIVKNGRPLSIGINDMRKTHNTYSQFHPYSHVHAEFAACNKKKFCDLSGCDIFVYREERNGKRANSKPCPSCQDYLREVGIRRAYFSTPTGYDVMYFT
jgi:tRNA(Arg) A34 adenosine deaminase TadA